MGEYIGIRGAYSFDKNNLKIANILYSQTKRAWRIAGSFGYQNLSTALNYGITYFVPEIGNRKKKTYIMASAKYQIKTPVAIYAQYLQNGDKTGIEKSQYTNIYSIGSEYKLAKNVVTWIEYAYYQKPKVDNESKYGVGLRIYL